jgi:5-amino-6-(5-phosphoribosylamino)uracil reductase/diaminohydroxyphosphoribosylaminopyrimidine deaminase/5-amino-6-(5-phosphoribosylamino)uracil reductase
LHFAQSLDGRIGLGPGCERALLSSEAGVVSAHEARCRHDAVLIGIETLLHDDPQLTARLAEGAQPLRVVLDSHLRLPLGARLLAPEPGAGQVLVFGSKARASAERRRGLEAAGATVALTEPDASGRVELVQALEILGRSGVKRVLVEGGAKVLTSFLEARLAERAEVEITPFWLGAGATAAFGDLQVTELEGALRLERTQVEWLGSSLLVRGDIAYPPRSRA